MTLDFLNIMRAGRKRPGHRQDGPGGFGRKAQIHHDGTGRSQHVDVDRLGALLLGRLHDFLHERNAFSGNPELFRPYDHAFRRRIIQHEAGDPEGLGLPGGPVFDQQLGRRGQAQLLRVGLFQILLQPVSEGGVSTIGVPEGEDRRRRGLSQEGLGAGDDARHGGRCGQPVLERQDHHIVEHLLFFDQRDSGLVVDEQHVDDAVAFFHQLGRVVAP